MNITTIIARKGTKLESLAIGEDGRSIKEQFKAMDETAGFDEIMLIDSRAGKIRGKKFARVAVKEKKIKVKAPEKTPEEKAPETPEEKTDQEKTDQENPTNEDVPDFLKGLD